jgi:hypothetical protein
MILIIGVLSSAYFMFTLSQNTIYNDAIRQKNLLEINLMSESINVTSQPVYTYTPSTGNVTVVADLQNDGPVYVQIKTLWVHGVNTNHYGFVGLNISLSGGQNQTINQPVTVNGSTAGEKFYGWIVTSRGQTIGLYPAHQTGPAGSQGQTGPVGQTGSVGPEGPPSVSALVSQGIGSVSMDFKSYNSYVVDGYSSSGNLGTPNPAFTFSLTARIAFSINVTNLDPSHMALNLTSNGQMWLFSPSKGAIKGEVWPLATVTNNVITTLNSNQFVILPFNHTTTLYFGPYSSGGSNLGVGITAVNLVLTGKIGSLDYGQNLPFISLIATA